MPKIQVLVPPILFFALLVLVITKVEPPTSLGHASAFQLISFFLLFLVTITFTINLFIKNLLISLSFGSFSIILLVSLHNKLLSAPLASLLFFGSLLIFLFRKKIHLPAKNRPLSNQPKSAKPEPVVTKKLTIIDNPKKSFPKLSRLPKH